MDSVENLSNSVSHVAALFDADDISWRRTHGSRRND